MQFNIKQRLKSILHQHRILIPENASEILKVSKTQDYDLDHLTRQYIEKKLVSNELNKISYYDIQKSKPKDPPFKSIHRLTEFQGQRNIQIYKKPTLTKYEKQVRSYMKLEPDKQLLMSEIYDKFEEKRFDQAQEEQAREEQQIHELDQWSKSLDRKRKETLKIQQSKIATILPFLRSGRRVQTLNITPGSRIPIASFNSPQAIKESEGEESEQVSPAKRFRDRIHKAIERSKEEKKKKSEMELDRKTSKQVQQYMARGQGISSEEIEKLGDLQEGQKESAIEYTKEGILKLYGTLVKVNQTEFGNEQEKGSFYQKQTSLIVEKLRQRLGQNEEAVGRKEKTMDALRAENLEIKEKLEQIYRFLGDLEREIEELNHLEAKGRQRQAQKNASDAVMEVLTKQQDLEDDARMLRDSQKNFKNKHKFNLATLAKLDKEVAVLNKQTKQVRNCLTAFYFHLLKQGNDFRNEGIHWLIHRLWHLDQKVFDKDLPPYLDQKAKQFVLYKATKTHHLARLHDEKLNHFKAYQTSCDQSVLSNSITLPSLQSETSKFSTFDLETLRTDRNRKKLTSTKLRLYSDLTSGMSAKDRKVTKRILSQLNVQSPLTTNQLIYLETKNKLRDYFKNDQPSASEPNYSLRESAIKQYEHLQNEIENEEKQLKHAQEEEIIRIVKEFDYRFYGQRYKVEPLQVFSCLIGGYNSDREITKHGMAKMNYSQQQG